MSRTRFKERGNLFVGLSDRAYAEGEKIRGVAVPKPMIGLSESLQKIAMNRCTTEIMLKSRKVLQICKTDRRTKDDPQPLMLNKARGKPIGVGAVVTGEDLYGVKHTARSHELNSLLTMCHGGTVRPYKAADPGTTLCYLEFSSMMRHMVKHYRKDT